MALKEELLIELVNALLQARIVLCFHQMSSAKLGSSRSGNSVDALYSYYRTPR
jgi:hypothetical protein